MEVRHNTKFLDEAIALVVRRAEIPTKEAEALAAERIARAAARRRLATGLAISIAALGIGAALWLGWHSRDVRQVTVREPYPVPGPTVTLTPEPRLQNPQPGGPSAPHTPLSDYTKFTSRTVFMLDKQWNLQAGHHFASDTQRDWDAAWCYSNTSAGKITVRADLATRGNPDSAPVGPIANAETLQSIGITDSQAAELAAQCPWLDGKTFSPQALIPFPNRIPPGAVTPEQPAPFVPPLSPDATPTPNPPMPLFAIKDGYDAIGNDLQGMPMESASLDDCQKDCSEDSACSAFTFDKKHGKCFLKGTTRILVASGQAVAGYNPGAGGITNTPLISNLNIHSKYAVIGKPYKGAVTQGFDMCLVMCEKEKMYCLGVNYDVTSFECNLFNNVTGTSPTPTMSSAERPTTR